MWVACLGRLHHKACDFSRGLFTAGYPLHPELIDTLKRKTATLGNFQRVRGMLRLLARSVARLWETRPEGVHALHLHHLDPGFEPILQEITVRLSQRQLVPAIRADVVAERGGQLALAQELDAESYRGLPPYGSYVARAVLFHTLAFNETLKGLTREQLRYALLSPTTDISFIDDAVRRFTAQSAYLDDRPNVPLRFLAEANLTQMIRRQEQLVDAGEVRAQLNDRIKTIFRGQTLGLVPFPGGPVDVPDDTGEGKPYLALIGYDAAEIQADRVTVPELVARIYRHKGNSEDLRRYRNNLVFLVADATRREEMRRKMTRRLALSDLRQPEKLNQLAEHQQEQLRERFQASERDLAVAIQQCYRHVLYPSRNRVEGADVDLAHSAIEMPSSAESPGKGQAQVVRVLEDNRKIRLPQDEPDSPTYIRDRTLLKRGQVSTTTLRDEFRRDPALPILVGDEVFIKGIRKGIELGEYVYQNGDMLCGQGDPFPQIKIDEQVFVYTAAYAREHEIWPRPVAPPPDPPPPGTGGTGTGDSNPGDGDGTDPGGTGTGGVGPDPVEPPPATAIVREGVLKEVLVQVWEAAQSRHIAWITTLIIRPFEAPDAFKLLAVASSIPKADKAVKISASYETNEGSELSMEFSGSVNDVLPVKEFLEPQLRAAQDKDFEASLTLTFQEGLALDGNETTRLTERLSRIVGAAYVHVTAEGDS